MSLLNDRQKQAKVHLLDTEPFGDALGPKKKRKCPKLMVSDYESLVRKADGSQDAFEQKHGAISSAGGTEGDGFRDLVRHTMFEKGQSKRIWGELYKVIDSSDVVVQCDLVPAWATKGWLRILSKEYPSLAFHASINKSFGKVRVTSLHDAAEHIGEVLKRVKKEHLERAYKIKDWEDENDFLVQLCKLNGKLLKVYARIIEASGHGTLFLGNLISRDLVRAETELLLFIVGIMAWDIFSSHGVVDVALARAIQAPRCAMLREALGVTDGEMPTDSALCVAMAGILIARLEP